MSERVELEREYWEKSTDIIYPYLGDNGLSCPSDINLPRVGGYYKKLAEFKRKYIADESLDDDKCLDLIKPHLKHHDVLEIGCGMGRLIKRLAMSSSFGCCNFVGIDISKKMLEVATDNTASQLINLGSVQYVVCDGRNIPAPDVYFDSIYSMLVFQHIPEEGVKSYLKEAFRILKPGGVFRFQYVTEAEKAPFSFPVDHLTMTDWCREAGFEIVGEDLGLIYDEWAWMTIRKPELPELALAKVRGKVPVLVEV